MPLILSTSSFGRMPPSASPRIASDSLSRIFQSERAEAVCAQIRVKSCMAQARLYLIAFVSIKFFLSRKNSLQEQT